MIARDIAVEFLCAGDTLIGIASMPEQPSARGVLIVVGGPQYRVGSHRQFVLLARALAEEGFPVLRFDYRGMGDSSGDMRDFERIDDDMRAAIDHMFVMVPTLADVVIWGLCDAASAAMMYAENDARVQGLILLNPWARSEQSFAKATLRHYYLRRLLERALWKKIFSLRFDYRAALRSLSAQVAALRTPRDRSDHMSGEAVETQSTFHSRMQTGLSRFRGKVLLITSGKDLTAKEFLAMADSDQHWKRLLSKKSVARYTMAVADHTFSRRGWRDQVSNWTIGWLKTW